MHAGIGPTEIRFAFIVVNILLATFGTTHLSFLLPHILVLAIVCLAVLVYRNAKEDLGDGCGRQGAGEVAWNEIPSGRRGIVLTASS